MNINIRFEINPLNILLGLNIFVFLLVIVFQVFFGLQFSENDRLVFDNFIFFGGLVFSPVQGIAVNSSLVTSAFFHIDIIHFLFNMFALAQIGSLVQNIYGGKKLFVTYILGAIGGSLAIVLTQAVLDEAVYALGASGAIFALLGLLVGGSLRKTRYGFSFPFRFQDILPVLILPLFVGFLPGVSMAAHLGGLFTGIALGFIFKHDLSLKDRFDEVVEVGGYYLSWTLLLLSYAILFLYIFI